ncbi:unnamed protein product [Rotaria sordida]|uniref:Alkaline phosphatase, tissue-nonspecific isozyme n=1 Tax=Rotaria sordida TaxID=392033 RepID=A0A813RK63_9BILA|nr:unnamed protein product [Rotaria sordida]
MHISTTVIEYKTHVSFSCHLTDQYFAYKYQGRKENKRIAKNIIFFLGDGMGVPTITAGRIRKGQMLGQLGEDFITEMEQFSHLGLAKTYCTDHQTPDSAATATALLCGVKTSFGTIGIDGRASRGNCLSSHGTHVDSILKWAQELGHPVGIVATSRITHASPASAYAHSPDRKWEGYDSINFGEKEVAQGCVDIARQLVLQSPPIDILLGGGRRFFYPTQKPDVANSSLNGTRTDNISLIDDFWKGSRIDHGHHFTQARYALDDYVEFDNTIGQVKRILQDKGVLNDTLLVVTADHSNAFSFGADSARGSNLFGFSTLESLNVSTIDKMPVQIITYGNGPNFPAIRNKTYLDSIDLNDTEYRWPAAIPMVEATHAGEDVAVFAQGPWSHLFIGTMEQHTIAHKMAYAACWGAYKKRRGCK